MGTVTLSTGAYDASDPAVGATVESDLAAIVAEVNGNIEAVNIKAGTITSTEMAASSVGATNIANNAVRQAHADYTSGNNGLEVWQTGPTHVGASGGRIARVRKSVIYNGTTPQAVTFTYATDCIDGNPAFSATPCLTGPPVVVSGSTGVNACITRCRATATSSTAITIEIHYDAGASGTMTDTVVMEFCVAGPI